MTSAMALAWYGAKKLGVKSVSVFYLDAGANNYSKAFADKVASYWKAYGVDVKAEVPFTPDQTSCSQGIKEASGDKVDFVDFEIDAGHVIQCGVEAQIQGYKPPKCWGGYLIGVPVIHEALGDYSIGMYAFDAFGDEYNNPDYINEVKKVSNKTDTYSSVTMGFFLAALVAGDGMRKLGDQFTRAHLRDVLDTFTDWRPGLTNSANQPSWTWTPQCHIAIHGGYVIQIHKQPDGSLRWDQITPQGSGVPLPPGQSPPPEFAGCPTCSSPARRRTRSDGCRPSTPWRLDPGRSPNTSARTAGRRRPWSARHRPRGVGPGCQPGHRPRALAGRPGRRCRRPQPPWPSSGGRTACTAARPNFSAVTPRWCAPPGCRAEPAADPWAPRRLWRTAPGLGARAARGRRGPAAGRRRPRRQARAFRGGVHRPGRPRRHRGCRRRLGRPATAAPTPPGGAGLAAWPVTRPAPGLAPGGAAPRRRAGGRQRRRWPGCCSTTTHGAPPPPPAPRRSPGPVVLADFVVIVALLPVIFASLAAQWGHGRRAARHRLDDEPEAQRCRPRRPVGWQGSSTWPSLGLARRQAGRRLPAGHAHPARSGPGPGHLRRRARLPRRRRRLHAWRRERRWQGRRSSGEARSA